MVDMARDPVGEVPWFTDFDDVWFTSVGVAMVSGLLCLFCIVAPWLWVLTPIATVLYVTFATVKLQTGKKKFVRAGVYAKGFREQWRRLDRSMQLELSDIYRSVIKMVDAVRADPSLECKLAIEVYNRAKAVEEVADELEIARSKAIRDSVSCLDDHALETAKLYVESLRQQRQEANK